MKPIHKLLTISLTCALLILIFLYLLFTPINLKHPKTFYIPPNTTVTQIANQLKQQHLIKSKTLFILLAKIIQKPLPAGQYQIEPHSNLFHVFKKIIAGETIRIQVTFPEGYDCQQMAQLLESQGLASQNKFLQFTKHWNNPAITIKSGNLEGYLFPDTYFFRKPITEQEIITKMLKRFQEVTAPLKVKAQNSEFTWPQIIILASLIEKEAKIPYERPLISAVLQNRLHQNMRLECDATVQYALSKHKSYLTYQDLKVNSPYNTYKIKGLPPASICNPGKASIEAAIYPADVDYLFYVAKPDGSHVFTRTFREHRQAIKNIRGTQ